MTGARLNTKGECEEKVCCKKTSLEAALWDKRVRGKCWVLREKPFFFDNGNGTAAFFADVERNQRATISVSAAYGIIALTTIFVLSFRACTRKMDSCNNHRKSNKTKRRF